MAVELKVAQRHTMKEAGYTLVFGLNMCVTVPGLNSSVFISN